MGPASPIAGGICACTSGCGSAGRWPRRIHYAHIQGVIHRDVKPGNVLLTPGDEAKLSDFGLSFVIGDRKDGNGSIQGTPVYMSPEQAQGLSLDHRTDLYSVGVMLYECATGELPFMGDVRSVLVQHKSAAPTPPRLKNPEIWSTLDKLILSLLAKTPVKRPALGNVVALELFEEAAHAERLLRINPGLRQTDARNPAAAPPFLTPSLGGVNSGLAPANGASQVDLGPGMLSATELPSLSLSGLAATTGPPTISSNAALESSRTSHAGGCGSARPPGRQADARRDAGACRSSLSAESAISAVTTWRTFSAARGGRGSSCRRPLDARNADRARLLLAMAWLASVGPTDEAIERAANCSTIALTFARRVQSRWWWSSTWPAVTLPTRTSGSGEIRKRLKEASVYARKSMLDANGVLNPGMMPRTLDDLAIDRPAARRAGRAPRLALEPRRGQSGGRKMSSARRSSVTPRDPTDRDAMSVDLWPEVVYPLIEHAHWQRTFRSAHRSVLGLRGRQAAPRARAGRPARPDDDRRHPAGGRRAARRGPLHVRGRPPDRRRRDELLRHPGGSRSGVRFTSAA